MKKSQRWKQNPAANSNNQQYEPIAQRGMVGLVEPYHRELRRAAMPQPVGHGI
jgi:hypothetical protein